MSWNSRRAPANWPTSPRRQWKAQRLGRAHHLQLARQCHLSFAVARAVPDGLLCFGLQPGSALNAGTDYGLQITQQLRGIARRALNSKGVGSSSCSSGMRYGHSGLRTRINTTEIWERHSYKVERIEQAMGAPQRNVYGPDGVLLIEDAEYTQKTEALRDLGFID